MESGTIMSVNGTWRSLVARFLGVEEVASSNLAVPTSMKAFVQKWMKAFLNAFFIIVNSSYLTFNS